MFLYRFDGGNDRVAYSKGIFASSILLMGYAKEHAAPSSRSDKAFNLFKQQINTETEYARHAGDGFLFIPAFDDKIRLEQVVCRQIRFTDKIPDSFGRS